MGVIDRTNVLKTNLKERVKQYCVYDASGRMTDAYEAHADAVDGTPCIHTQYEYDGTSGRILKRRELNGEWDSSYD